MFAAVSLSERADTADAVAEAVDTLAATPGFERADAALCWVTPEHGEDLPGLVDALNRRLATPNLAGCVAAGITIGDREIVGSPGVGLMALSDNTPERFSVCRYVGLGDAPEAAAQALRGDTEAGDLLFTMVTADTFRAPPFLEPLQGMGATLIGGGAANPRAADQIFTSKGAAADAMASLRISACNPQTALTHSCRPISPLMTVTGCVGRLLTELGGRPALEVLRDVLRPADGRRSSPPSGPLMVGLATTTGGERLVRGEYLVRPLVGLLQDNGALLVGDVLRQGMGLAFVAREAEAARSDLSLMLMELQARLDGHRPAFAIYANCAGRGPGFQQIPDYEASVIGAYLPGVPVGGFFGGFELGPVRGNPQVHFYTAVMALGMG